MKIQQRENSFFIPCSQSTLCLFSNPRKSITKRVVFDRALVAIRFTIEQPVSGGSTNRESIRDWRGETSLGPIEDRTDKSSSSPCYRPPNEIC